MKEFMKLKTRLRFSHFIVIACALIMSGLDCSKEENKCLNIGIIVPLTGGAADFGMWAQNGVHIAVEELNEKRNRKIRVFFEDSRMNTNEGLSAFKKLVSVNKVSAVITSGSGVVLGIAPVADADKILQLNHAAVSPKIRDAGDYTFTLVNDADIETDEMASLVINKLGLKNMAVLYANTSYGVGTKDAVVRSFTQLGGKIVATESFEEDSADFRSQLLKLRQARPQATYFVANIKDSGRLLKQAQELGFKTQWVSYNAFESPEVINIAGQAAEGVIYTSSNLFDTSLASERENSFYGKYLKKYDMAPNIYAATAYDAVYLIALAHENTDGSGEAMKNFLYRIKDYQGASGLINFDATGSARKPVFLKTVRDGKFVIYQ